MDNMYNAITPIHVITNTEYVNFKAAIKLDNAKICAEYAANKEFEKFNITFS